VRNQKANSAKWYAAHKEKQRARNRAWRAKNPEKVKAAQLRWRAKNPDKHKNASRKNRGLPTPTRPAPIICECCGSAPGKLGMALDHDHVTGKFRGWLCRKCNLGLGLLGDTLDAVQRAVLYLERA
jgi:hypothetical protein